MNWPRSRCGVAGAFTPVSRDGQCTGSSGVQGRDQPRGAPPLLSAVIRDDLGQAGVDSETAPASPEFVTFLQHTRNPRTERRV
jgi:hypothetical protein